jgi:hypothetical protein
MTDDTTDAGRKHADPRQAKVIAGLQQAVERLGTIEALAFASGIPLRTIKGWLAGETNPKMTAVMQVADAAGMTIAEIVGAGPEAHVYDFCRVPRLAFNASAGSGLFVQDDIEGSVPFSRALLQRIGVPLPYVRVLEADGDSMAPTINDGDLMLIDRRARTPVDDQVFVFTMGDEVYVKRLRKVPGQGWTIVSDNPNIPAVPVHEDADLRIIGRVRWTERDL